MEENQIKLTREDMIKQLKEKGLSTSLAKKALKDANGDMDEALKKGEKIVKEIKERAAKSLADYSNKLKKTIKEDIIKDLVNELKGDSIEEIEDKLKKIFSLRRSELIQEYRSTVKEMIFTFKDFLSVLEEHLNNEKYMNSTASDIGENLSLHYVQVANIAGKIGVMIEAVRKMSIIKEVENESPKIIKEIISKQN